ncbi:nitrate- and nitrite sensing domain-containing protein [Streptosporangium sp. DT93]|uniref:sensor histidine kinase n=1 Tax=Streptosporangium sp. DT93 TaxID=3393428 RepID=UPI003CFB86AB
MDAMRVRNGRLRTKVTALLVSLTALWAFTAWVTVREGVNMLGVATLDTNVAQPSEKLVGALQTERRLTLIAQGDPRAGRRMRDALTAQRKRTDAAGTEFRRLTGSGSVRTLGSDMLGRRIAEVYRKLDGLAADRKAIDAARTDRTRAATSLTEVISSIYHIYDSMATLDDKEIAADVRTLIELSRALETLSQEDAMAAGALAAGRLTDAERSMFTQIVGVQRFLFREKVDELPEADRVPYLRLAEDPAYLRMRIMEDQLIQARTPMNMSEPVDAQQWASVTQPVLVKLQQTILLSGDSIVERSMPVATGVIVRLALAGGLGLVAVVASVVLAITTARALVQQLEKLRAAAWELANERLPSVVERIGHGETVDVAAEAPPLKFGDDQIGQVGQAFNAVQQTAVKVAVEQAQLRRDIADILRNLARRTQSLVHRQLSVLDVMERRENDPQELRDLFRLDHLATRMRRYAENLLVLSGAAPGRAWRDAVPMIDVVRGSLAEIEDYTRIDVMPLGEVSLDGRAVSDVIHLVAELVENAASFSPPYTTVQVTGQPVAHGYALEIEDRGLGMSPEDIVAANERIANPPELKLSGNARLGLYVVSRLAERHDIRVTFKASPYGGTTVVVLVPQELITQDPAPVTGSVTGPAVPVGVPQARTASTGEMNGTAPGTSGPAGMPGLAADPDLTAGLAGRLPQGRHSADATTARGGDRATDTAMNAAMNAAMDAVRDPSADVPGGAATGRFADPAAPSGAWDRLPDYAAPAAPARRRRRAAEDAGTGVPDEPVTEGPGVSEASEAAGAAGAAGTLLPPVLPPPDSSHTPGGLPRRVPQTHLAAPLLDGEPAAPPPAEETGTDARSPEEIRAAMSSFQAGTRRGRDDADRLHGSDQNDQNDQNDPNDQNDQNDPNDPAGAAGADDPGRSYGRYNGDAGRPHGRDTGDGGRPYGRGADDAGEGEPAV